MAFDLQKIRAQFPILERQVNGHPLCYLDNAATTFSPQPVLDSYLEFETQYRANVARGVHQLAQEATEAYEQARTRVARYLNASSESEVVFTSGTTASMNLLAFGLAERVSAGDEVLVSTLEHHSNFLPWQRLCETRGAKLKLIPVKENAELDFAQLDALVTQRTRIIALAQASNVTGAMHDLAPIRHAADRVGALVVVDGAQAVSHGPVDLQQLGADFYAFSGHKCFGPTGVGVLWGRAHLLADLPAWLVGGGMVERVTATHARYLDSSARLEAGTPPVAQAIGLGVALDWLMGLPWPEIRAHEARLAQLLHTGLQRIDGLRLFGPSTPARLPIFSFDIDGCHPHDLCQVADEFGVALRGGHHCAQPLMDALGVTATTRASAALFNSEAEIEQLLTALVRAIEVLR